MIAGDDGVACKAWGLEQITQMGPVTAESEGLRWPLQGLDFAPDGMIGTMVEAGLDGAVFGFGVETAFHGLRMLTTGVFDPEVTFLMSGRR